MKQKIILIISIAIGLFAAFLTNQYLSAKELELTRTKLRLEHQYKKTDVVVLTRNLPSGTKLTADDLGYKAFPEQALRGQVIHVEKNVLLSLIGRTLAVGVEMGKPLIWSDIEGGNLDTGVLAPLLKQKMRAISINVSGAASVSGMVRPADRVDVIGTFTLPSKDGKLESELVTMTVLQDVLVLATGKETSKSAGKNVAQNYSTVTLEVTPHEAEVLIFAEQIRGRLALSLRNPHDVHYEKDLPQVNFEQIRGSLENLNEIRQNKILRKPAVR